MPQVTQLEGAAEASDTPTVLLQGLHSPWHNRLLSAAAAFVIPDHRWGRG